MCHYQTDLQWRRRRAVDERPRDVVSTELDGLVEAYRPASVARPLRQRIAGAVCAVYGRLRRGLGGIGSRPGTRLHPGAH